MTSEDTVNLKSRATIDVVLATTGKSSRLTEVVDAIIDQSYEIDKLFIIWNSAAQPDQLSKYERNPRVVVLVKPEVNGAASAYNLGIRESLVGGSDFKCLAADDDVWHHEKIAKQIECMTDSSIVFTSAIFVNEFQSFKRPKDIFPKNQNPSDIFFSKKSILKYSNYYLPISSVMFPKSAAEHSFNERLVVREDIEWIQRLYSHGFKIIQLREALINVGSDYVKASKREFISDIEMFLEGITSQQTKQNFLLYTLPRSSVLAGDNTKLSELHNFIMRSVELNLQVFLQLCLQRIVCFCALSFRYVANKLIQMKSRIRSKK